MPRKSRDLAAQAERIADAWQRFFPNKTFSGLTLEQFREAFKPCREVRVELAQLASQTKSARFRRRKLDLTGRPVLLRVVHAVCGDPDVGEDSSMYSAMGYTAKGRRRKPGPKRKVSASRAAADARAPTARRRKQPSRAHSG
jgi:hypothetical protein